VAAGIPGATPFGGHASPVHCVAFSPDGTTLASGGEDGLVRFWDTATWEQASEITAAGHAGPIRDIAYSPDGATIATADADAGIRLRNTATWEEEGQFTIAPEGPPSVSSIRDIAWSPDGTTIAAACLDGIIGLWNLATSQQRGQFSPHAGSATAIGWSPDGNAIATGGPDAAVRLWAPETGEQTAQLTGYSGAVRALAYSPDGTALAAGDTDFTCRVWNFSTAVWTARRARGVNGQVNAVGWSPDGNTIAAGYSDGAVCLYDASARENPAEYEILAEYRHNHAVNAVAFSPDSRILASGAGSVRLWDTVTGRQTARLTAHTHSVKAVAWSPDGTSLATGAGGVRVWDTSTWEPRGRLRGHGGAVRAVAWSPDGTVLAAVGGSRTVQLWDTTTWQSRGRLAGHTDTVRGVAWNPRGTVLASVGDDGTIRIWNPRNGTQINGTGFGVPRAPARPLAGVRSDSPSGEDLLGIGDDVGTLAELIAATETRPPLAIALIGDWGAGKSSVMLQVERQITVLADRARNNPGQSAFTENVRQVRFNAWHYSDDHLWAGLISHLFEALAPAPDESTREQGKIAENRDRLRGELKRKQDARDKLANELKAADEVPQPQGLLEWLGSPAYAAKVVLTASGQALRDTRTALLAILAWLVLGAVACAAWHFLGTRTGTVITVIAVLASPLAAVARKLKSGHDAVLSFVNQQRSSLTARQKGYEQEIRHLEDQLMLVDAAARLERFLDDRGGNDAYRSYQGLLGKVHADLGELSADLTAARAQWTAGGGIGAPPLERIVLYIDDLDRCPPRRVIDVLEAVHLMLALDLFVVVVAVDARWLIRSLEYHHHELFRENDGDGEIVATPVDYLDKIFQIPFALRRPGPVATARYLRSLLPEPVPAAPVTSHATPSEQDVNTGGGPDPAPSAEASPALTSQDSPSNAGPVLNGPAPAKPETDQAQDPDQPALSRLPVELPGIPYPPAPDEAPPAPVIELRPQGLQLSRPEIEFMTRLGGLVPTPRAAKRLVNIYRLVRIGIPDAELPAFTDDADSGPYRTVQVLLAILIGHPKAAGIVFRELLAAGTDDDLVTVAEKAAGELDDADASFPLIRNELTRLQDEESLTISVAECQHWCPALARFSFYTRDLARA
jgi:WD40 repeat protein